MQGKVNIGSFAAKIPIFAPRQGLEPRTNSSKRTQTAPDLKWSNKKDPTYS